MVSKSAKQRAAKAAAASASQAQGRADQDAAARAEPAAGRPGPRRSRCRRSIASRSSTSCRRSTRALPPTARRSRPSPATRRRRRSPTPSMRWSARATSSIAPRAVFFNLAGTDTNEEIQAIERAMAPRFAKHGMRIYQDETLFARVDALFKKRKKLQAERGAGARAGALSPRLRQVRRRARAQGQEAAGGDCRAHVRARHALQPEPAGRRAGLRAGAGRRDGPRRPAGSGAGGGGADGERARPQGQARHHAVALQHRAVPAVFGPARSAREGVQRLDHARRQRRQDRQPQDRGRDPGPQGRAGAAAGLQDGGGLRARVLHGEDARRPCASC